MKPVSTEAMREILLKRSAPTEGRKKEAVAKRPRVSGPSVGAPAAAAKPTGSRVVFVPPRAPAPSDEDVEIVAAPSPASVPTSSAPTTSAPTSRASGKAPIQGTSSKASGCSSSQRGGEVATPKSAVGRSTFVTREQVAEGWLFRVHTGPEDSAVNDPGVARELTRVLLHPRDVKEMKTRGVNELVNSAYPSLARLAHDVEAMRGLILRYAESAHTWETQTKSARDQAKAAERARDEAVEKAKAAERARDEAVEKEKETASRLKKKEEALAKAADDLDRSETERRLAANQSLASEERAKVAEKQTKVAEARAKESEAQLESASARAKELEAQLKSAGVQAVEEYKGSYAFEIDAGTASVGVYYLGFDDCRKRVAELFPDLDLSTVVAPGEQSAGSGEEEPVGDNGEAAGVPVSTPEQPSATAEPASRAGPTTAPRSEAGAAS